MKRTLSLSLALLLLLGAFPMGVQAAGLENFKIKQELTAEYFADVSPEDWFYKAVASAYGYGLMSGTGDQSFSPNGELTVAQTIALAARLHSIYHSGTDSFERTEPWHKAYVDYALEKGMIFSEPEELDKAVTRLQFADILHRALPAAALKEINVVETNSIPDVLTGSKSFFPVYQLYRAGILTGSDKKGSFLPDSSITRAEAAAIINRMADEKQRKRLNLYTIKDNSFFADAAFLGNSLVDGIRLYTDINTADFYCASSVTVYTAMNSLLAKSAEGKKVSLVEALGEKQYGKIYVELGINEVAFEKDYFIELYSQLIDALQEAEPDADIYIMSLTPVTKEKADSGNIYTAARLRSFNSAIRKLASDKGCTYLDLYTAYQNSEGYLNDGWTEDGVHPYPEYYYIWEDFLRVNYKR